MFSMHEEDTTADENDSDDAIKIYLEAVTNTLDLMAWATQFHKEKIAGGLAHITNTITTSTATTSDNNKQANVSIPHVTPSKRFPYSDEFIQSVKTNQRPPDHYKTFILEEVNRHVANFNLVYVYTCQNMLDYIQANPNKNRIGFILEKPEYLQGGNIFDEHVYPVYFERTQNKGESFVFFDSAQGDFLILPAVAEKNEQKRRVYYNPFRRQATGKGCFEDAVFVLLHMANMNNFMQFCEENAMLETSLEPLTAEENREYLRLWTNCKVHGMRTLGEEGEEKLYCFTRRNNYNTQLDNEDIDSLAPIYQLSVIPSQFLTFIERRDSMRCFLKTHPTLFAEPMVDFPLYTHPLFSAEKPQNGETIVAYIKRLGSNKKDEKFDGKNESNTELYTISTASRYTTWRNSYKQLANERHQYIANAARLLFFKDNSQSVDNNAKIESIVSCIATYDTPIPTLGNNE